MVKTIASNTLMYSRSYCQDVGTNNYTKVLELTMTQAYTGSYKILITFHGNDSCQTWDPDYPDECLVYYPDPSYYTTYGKVMLNDTTMLGSEGSSNNLGWVYYYQILNTPLASGDKIQFYAHGFGRICDIRMYFDILPDNQSAMFAMF